MATPRPFDSYPKEYSELFLQAASREVIIPCNNRKAAERLRGRLYAYRRALAETPEKASKTALIADTVQLSINENKLIVSPLEPLTSSIKEALPDDKSTSEISEDTRQHDDSDGEELHGEISE